MSALSAFFLVACHFPGQKTVPRPLRGMCAPRQTEEGSADASANDAPKKRRRSRHGGHFRKRCPGETQKNLTPQTERRPTVRRKSARRTTQNLRIASARLAALENSGSCFNPGDFTFEEVFLRTEEPRRCPVERLCPADRFCPAERLCPVDRFCPEERLFPPEPFIRISSAS